MVGFFPEICQVLMGPKNSRCFVGSFRIARFGDLTKQKACSCLKKLRCNCSDFCKNNHAIFSKRWPNSWWESQAFCMMETLEPTSLPKILLFHNLCQNLTVFCLVHLRYNAFMMFWQRCPVLSQKTRVFFSPFSGLEPELPGEHPAWIDFHPKKVEQKEAKRGNMYDEPYKTHRKLSTSPTGFVHLFLLLGIKTETLSKRKASSIALEKKFKECSFNSNSRETGGNYITTDIQTYIHIRKHTHSHIFIIIFSLPSPFFDTFLWDNPTIQVHLPIILGTLAWSWHKFGHRKAHDLEKHLSDIHDQRRCGGFEGNGGDDKFSEVRMWRMVVWFVRPTSKWKI